MGNLIKPGSLELLCSPEQEERIEEEHLPWPKLIADVWQLHGVHVRTAGPQRFCDDSVAENIDIENNGVVKPCLMGEGKNA